MSNWGNKRNAYYGKEKKVEEVEEDEDNLELQEALKLQEKKFSRISEMEVMKSDDESLHEEDEKTISEDEEIEQKHLESILSKEEKDEITLLFKNIKSSFTEYNHKFSPLSELAKENDMQNVGKYIDKKGKMIKTYLTYLLYYAVLKSEKQINDHHPIIKKLIYLKSLIDKSTPIDDKIMPSLAGLVNDEEEEEDEQEEDNDENNEDLEDSDEESLENNAKIIKANEKKLNSNIQEDELSEEESLGQITKRNTEANSKKKNENKFLGKKKKEVNIKEEIEDEFYQENLKSLEKTKEKLVQKNIKKEKKLKEEIQEKDKLGQKVANENIIKSRGLYRKRKKYQGNAKLHLREKFTKKMNKRKNYVKEYTGKPLNYAGEATGIRDDLIRGTKLY